MIYLESGLSEMWYVSKCVQFDNIAKPKHLYWYFVSSGEGGPKKGGKKKGGSFQTVSALFRVKYFIYAFFLMHLDNEILSSW